MDKKTEALKLAQDLRVLADRFSEGWHDGIKIDASDILLLSDAAEALAEQQPAQQQSAERGEPVAWVREHELPLAPGDAFSWVETFFHKTPLYTSPQPAQEPVAWIYKPNMELLWPDEIEVKDPSKHRGYKPLYTSPQPAQQQEPIERCMKHGECFGGECIYTSPQPSKPWVGLTEEDIRPLCNQAWVFDTVKQWSQIIEAKLREKNA